MNKKPFLEFISFWVMIGWVMAIIVIIIFSIFNFILC